MSVRKRRQIPPGAHCPEGSEWYTCTGTPSFFSGCCKSNACVQNQCPSKDLVAAISSPASSARLPHPSNANPSQDFVGDISSPASSAGSPYSSNANSPEDAVGDISSPGLPYSPNANPPDDVVVDTAPPDSSAGLPYSPNENSSDVILVDTASPDSSAGLPYSPNADLSMTDFSEPLPQPPDGSLNEQSSPSSASSAGLPHSTITNPSTTDFTEPFPFLPEGAPDAPHFPLITPPILTTPPPSVINSLSSRMTTIGATIGGIGGVAILILLCVVFMLYRRQKISKNSSPMPAPVLQDTTSLGTNSVPCVSQLAGSPISELQSPSNAIHELPLPSYHTAIVRRISSASTCDEHRVGTSLTGSSVSHRTEIPM